MPLTDLEWALCALGVDVSDSSCLIDLRKASLLDALVRLPCELLIPNTLFGDGLLRFTAAEKRALLRGGLQVVDLRGDRVTRAVEVSREAPRVSIHHMASPSHWPSSTRDACCSPATRRFAPARQLAHWRCAVCSGSSTNCTGTTSCLSRPYSTRSRCSPPTRPSDSQRAKSRQSSGVSGAAPTLNGLV